MTHEQNRIERHLARLHRYAISLSRDEDLARDLVQECAVKALAAKRRPTDEPAYRAWLFRIVRNAFIDRIRRDRTAATLDAEPEDARPVEYWQGDERLIEGLTVRVQMQRLPTRHREILTLIDVVGLSYAEAAQVLKVPPGTVMSRISRARRALLEAIGESNVRPLASVRKRQAR